jgi:hypothetical protein
MKARLATWCLTVALLALLAGSGWPIAAPTGTARADLIPTGRACISFCLDNAGQAVQSANCDNEIRCNPSSR